MWQAAFLPGLILKPNEDEPLDVEGVCKAFAELTKLQEEAGRSAEELAYGFLLLANEAMCWPIRNLTQLEMKGFDITRTHKLACFGGAGPQHACAMAKALGMKKVLVVGSWADAEQEPAPEKSTTGRSEWTFDPCYVVHSRQLAPKPSPHLSQDGRMAGIQIWKKYLEVDQSYG
ncbi:5-oxoprolinase [Seminavis robusta]|uniref:5-oxoprolinase n=1 Tax=Seminavis robusta TaxID=568900 RepID=A0A9N8EIA4_9STRA|nr:5-oxoprolinase [Seminavis robusta]|eukprot:Sro980_g227320.1 5-oxoprolinase (174) ;mRNA; r:834-1355